MTDLETVAEALGVGEEALAAFVGEDTTPAAVLGRFPDADAEYAEGRALVEAWLGGDTARVSGPNGGAAGDAHVDGEGDDAGSQGDDRADPSGGAEGEAHDEPGPVTEANIVNFRSNYSLWEETVPREQCRSPLLARRVSRKSGC